MRIEDGGVKFEAEEDILLICFDRLSAKQTEGSSEVGFQKTGLDR